MNRTYLLAAALLVSILFNCESSAKISRLRLMAHNERKAAEARGDQAAAAQSKAQSDLAEAKRLRRDAAALQDSVQSASQSAARALAAAKAEHEAAIGATKEARLARDEAVESILQSKLKLAEAEQLRSAAQTKESDALAILAIAENERTLAREELAAAKEARASAESALAFVRKERMSLDKEIVNLDRRQALLQLQVEQAQLKTVASQAAESQAKEARQAIAHERTLMWAHQSQLRASIDGLQEQMTQAEGAMAKIQAAESARVIASARQSIQEAVTRLSATSQQVAAVARGWAVQQILPTGDLPLGTPHTDEQSAADSVQTVATAQSWIAAISRALAQAPRAWTGGLQ